VAPPFAQLGGDHSPDAFLPSDWHLNLKWVPVPPVPTGETFYAEMRRCIVKLPSVYRHEPVYQVESFCRAFLHWEHQVRQVEPTAASSTGHGTMACCLYIFPDFDSDPADSEDEDEEEHAEEAEEEEKPESLVATGVNSLEYEVEAAFLQALEVSKCEKDAKCHLEEGLEHFIALSMMVAEHHEELPSPPPIHRV
jgi:hypothetical protein